MIRIVEGDILNATEDIICQQVDCQGVMSGDLSNQIIAKYPEVYPKYKKYCDGCRDNDNRNLLGDVQTIILFDGKIMANLFGQYSYGIGKQYTNYGALRECLEGILKLSIAFNSSLALPYNLGCGLAGGDWSIVYKIIEEVFENYYVTIYKLV